MGPRSADRGNLSKPFRRKSRPTLQWGRDQLIAEMPDRPQLPLVQWRLQWGRDQLIAEMIDPLLTLPGIVIASMGPRSADRGNKLANARQSHARSASMGPRS